MVGTKSHGYSNSGRLSEGDTRCRFFCTCHSPSLQHHEVLKKKEQETFTANMILHTYTLKPMSVLVMGRLDQRSINRRRYGTIAFGH